MPAATVNRAHGTAPALPIFTHAAAGQPPVINPLMVAVLTLLNGVWLMRRLSGQPDPRQAAIDAVRSANPAPSQCHNAFSGRVWDIACATHYSLTSGATHQQADAAFLALWTAITGPAAADLLQELLPSMAEVRLVLATTRGEDLAPGVAHNTPWAVAISACGGALSSAQAAELIAQHYWSVHLWWNQSQPPQQSVWYPITGAAGEFLAQHVNPLHQAQAEQVWPQLMVAGQLKRVTVQVAGMVVKWQWMLAV